MSRSAETDGSMIELSTVHFYRGSCPRVLSLKGCSLPMYETMPEMMCGFYGRQGKQDGFMAAYAYAQANQLEFTVIDFLVKLDLPINPVKMSVDDLRSHDFLHLAQARRELWNTVSFLIEEEADEEVHSVHQEIDGKLLLLDRPGLIARVADDAAFRHFKALAFDSRTFISPRTLSIGVVPFRHWNSIVQATCRLNPTTQVLLDSPLKEHKPSARRSGQAPKNRPRGGA